MRVCPGCRTVYEEHIVTCPKDGLPLIDRSPTFAGLVQGETSQPARTRDTTVRPGMMIGEYQVEGVIAEGGMGVIYAGIHPLIRKRVAIKVLNKRFAQDPKAVSRFVLEARSVNEIGHHNIVDIFSIGELDDQRNYLIMEYLDGLALHEILLKVKRLRPGEIHPIYEQLCDALKAAHAKGFIHRDLKPDNVIVLRRPPFPFIKILDFGLAKLRGSITSTNTEVGTVLGTPEYMAPEQCRGDNVDARTDVYALGVMLYELTTGRHPFTDKSPFRVLAMQQRDVPKPPSAFSQIPEALEWVILRAMAKHPNQRFQTVEDLMNHLTRVVTERLPWTINLDPIEAEPAPVETAEQNGDVPAPRPQKVRNISVPRPIAISDEMSDDEIETLVADSRPGMVQPIEILRMLRKVEDVQEIRGDADSDAIAMPSVRNVRLAPAEARAPAPLLGTPNSGELEDLGATEISDPPDVTHTEVGGPMDMDAPQEEPTNENQQVAVEPPTAIKKRSPAPIAAGPRQSGTAPRPDAPGPIAAVRTESLANRPSLRKPDLPLFGDPAPAVKAAEPEGSARITLDPPPTKPDSSDLFVDVPPLELRKGATDVDVTTERPNPPQPANTTPEMAKVQSGVYAVTGVGRAITERESSSPSAHSRPKAAPETAERPVASQLAYAKTVPLEGIQQEFEQRLELLEKVKKPAAADLPGSGALMFDVEPPSLAELAQQQAPPSATWTPRRVGATIPTSARVVASVSPHSGVGWYVWVLVGLGVTALAGLGVILYFLL